MYNHVINNISTNAIQAYPINITFRSSNNLDYLGEFYEEEGILKFKGDVHESGKVFVDFICKSFNNRIDDLVKEKISNQINKQLELELEC